MELYSEGKNYKLYQGNMLDMLEVIEPNSIDSIVTDPPYGLTSIVDRFGKEGSAPAQYGTDGAFGRLSKGFMGKEWDGSGIEYNVETWRKCYTVLKSGGYLLAFGGSRTFHRIACAIEDAGFEIRDTIMWLYGSGFPKSTNIGLMIDKKNEVDNRTGNTLCGVGKHSDTAVEGGMFSELYEERKAQNEWNGWGTCLKPAYEPIIVARKPCEGSCVDNVLKYGVGGINIDECRVPFEDTPNPATNPLYRQQNGYKHDRSKSIAENSVVNFNTSASENPISSLGRFPSNVILTYDETDFDEVCGGMPYTKSTGGSGEASKINTFSNTYNGGWGHDKNCANLGGLGDEGSVARYYYCAKASVKDRDEGCEALDNGLLRRMRPDKDDDNPTGLNKEGRFAPVVRKNTHPTVKPCELMQYLVRLVTPQGGTVLDPFNGSGSTGKACMYENRERASDYHYIGIELTEEYLPIADARIACIANQKHRRRLV